MTTQLEKDKKAQHKHAQKAQTAFQALFKLTSSLAKSIKEVEKDPKARAKMFMKQLKLEPEILAQFDKFIKTFLGSERVDAKVSSRKKALLYLLRDAHFKPRFNLSKALDKVYTYASVYGYVTIVMGKEQANLRNEIPEDLLEFLPQRIVVKTDKDGLIKKITERLGNKQDTLDKKIESMAKATRNYNKIVKKISKDLSSRDEDTKIAALITAIILETGIRPGKDELGQTMVKDPKTGEKIALETFGALNLLTRHLTFEDNYAVIAFTGKKGTENVVNFTDKKALKVLKAYAKKALKISKSGAKLDANQKIPVFSKKDGKLFSRSALRTYFNAKVFTDITPRTLRALKATRAVMESLHEQQNLMYDVIRKLVKKKKKDLKVEIVKAIRNALEEALERAKVRLSHDAYRTTIDSYANPRVMLNFLSQGRIENNLESNILSGKTYLKFDPQVFIEHATAR